MEGKPLLDGVLRWDTRGEGLTRVLAVVFTELLPSLSPSLLVCQMTVMKSPISFSHSAPGQEAVGTPHLHTPALFCICPPFSSQFVELENLIKQIHLQNLTMPRPPDSQ